LVGFLCGFAAKTGKVASRKQANVDRHIGGNAVRGNELLLPNNKSTKEPTTQPTTPYQPNNQLANQPIKQQAKQPNNQPTKHPTN
jgi:hypothetical protein